MNGSKQQTKRTHGNTLSRLYHFPKKYSALDLCITRVGAEYLYRIKLMKSKSFKENIDLSIKFSYYFDLFYSSHPIYRKNEYVGGLYMVLSIYHCILHVQCTYMRITLQTLYLDLIIIKLYIV